MKDGYDYIWNKFYFRFVILQNEIEFNTILSLREDFDFNCRVISAISGVMFAKDTIMTIR